MVYIQCVDIIWDVTNPSFMHWMLEVGGRGGSSYDGHRCGAKTMPLGRRLLVLYLDKINVNKFYLGYWRRNTF